MLHPLGVVQVPLHRLADASLEGLGRLPAQFALDLARIDSVAAIMAGAVGHKGDLLAVAFAVNARAQFVKQGANGVDNFEVGLFIPAADVVHLADVAGIQYAADGAAMVFDVEPVADLLAVAIHGQGLACQGVDDHQRDELFGEVVGAVVVAAVCREYRQAVGVVVGANQMVAGSLARRIRAIRFVTVGFGEGRVVLAERPVNFIGGNVQEAEGLPGVALQTTPVGTDCFQQTEGADDVGLDEVFRAVDAAVDVALGRKIDDSARLVLSEEVCYQR